MWVYVYLLYFWFFPFCYFGMVQYKIGFASCCPFVLSFLLLLFFSPFFSPFHLHLTNMKYTTFPPPSQKPPFLPPAQSMYYLTFQVPRTLPKVSDVTQDLYHPIADSRNRFFLHNS